LAEENRPFCFPQMSERQYEFKSSHIQSFTIGIKIHRLSKAKDGLDLWLRRAVPCDAG
jgi:hypothetical protein